MNEKIMELAKRCQNNDGTVVWEKFAELIVQECIDAVRAEGGKYLHKSAGEAQSGWFIDAIRERMGVE